MTHEDLDEEVENKSAHVQTRRIGKVLVQISETSSGTEPIVELVRVLPLVSIATNGSKLSVNGSTIEQDGGLFELYRLLGAFDAVDAIEPSEIDEIALRHLKETPLNEMQRVEVFKETLNAVYIWLIA